MRSCLAVGGQRMFPWWRSHAIGRTASSWARRCPARRRRRPRGISANFVATRSPCCRSAATTWRTTGATGSRSARSRNLQPPRVYSVNWFRRDADERFIWPGFSDNSRVIDWIVQRLSGRRTVETAVGLLPVIDQLNLGGVDLSDDDVRESIPRDAESWRAEAQLTEQYFEQFGDRVPGEVEPVERTASPPRLVGVRSGQRVLSTLHGRNERDLIGSVLSGRRRCCGGVNTSRTLDASLRPNSVATNRPMSVLVS